MWIQLVTRKLFWQVLGELLLLELTMSFADNYETARRDARRRLHAKRHQAAGTE